MVPLFRHQCLSGSEAEEHVQDRDVGKQSNYA